MYHCPRCNKPFNYANKLSVHSRTNCPNKDGPEIYQRMIDLDEKLEEKFKPKVPLEIENPEAIQAQEVVQDVGEGDQPEGGVQDVGEGDQPEGGVQIVGEGDQPEGAVEEQPQVTGEPLAQELLQAIQQHEQQQQPERQEDVIIIKSDDVEEDDGERLLDVMSQGIIPDLKDDEENGGQIKPEEDALLD